MSEMNRFQMSRSAALSLITWSRAGLRGVKPTTSRGLDACLGAMDDDVGGLVAANKDGAVAADETYRAAMPTDS